MNESLPDFAKRLLDEARALESPPPSPEVLERVLARVGGTVGFGTGAAVAVTAGSKVLFGLVMAGLGAAAGVGGTLAVQRLLAQPPENAPLPVASAPVPVPVPLPVVVAPIPVTSPPSPPPRTMPRPPPTPATAPVPAAAVTPPDSSTTLDAEQVLVDMARAALVQQRPDAALDALNRHRREHPRGQLAEERDALEVQALWNAHRENEARARTTDFHRTYPNSIFGAGLDALGELP